MALLWNYSVLLKNPSRSYGWLGFKGNLSPWDSKHNIYFTEASDGNFKYSAFPHATQDQYSLYMPFKTGWALSSTTSIKWQAGTSFSLTMWWAISASMSGTWDLSATLGLLTALSSTLAWVGAFSMSLSASLGLASNMSGTWALSASMSMSVPLAISMSWVGALTANLKGNASLSATIYVNSSQADVQQIVDGVWNAIAADYNTSGTMGEAVQTGGGGGGWATAAQIWSYSSRTLTESAWLTIEQAEQLEQVYDRVDTPVSEIAVWWNPYIEWVNWLKKWIQKIVDKVEDKGEEVKAKIEWEVKSIVIPEQKEPIVNVTTEKVDTKEFLKAIKDIKPEVSITTEQIDTAPILTAIKDIWKISDIVIPEQKQPEIDFSPINKSIEQVNTSLQDQLRQIEVMKKYIEDKIEQERLEKEQEQNREREIKEEENMKRPLPSQFTAILK
jgi:ribosomal protein L25 (general stress protein Ctc)